MSDAPRWTRKRRGAFPIEEGSEMIRAMPAKPKPAKTVDKTIAHLSISGEACICKGWTDSTGFSWCIQDMESSHIVNALQFLERRYVGRHDKKTELKNEIERRQKQNPMLDNVLDKLPRNRLDNQLNNRLDNVWQERRRQKDEVLRGEIKPRTITTIPPEVLAVVEHALLNLAGGILCRMCTRYVWTGKKKDVVGHQDWCPIPALIVWIFAQGGWGKR